MDAMEAERKKGDAKKDGDENGEGEDKLPGSAKEVVADDADRQLEIELAECARTCRQRCGPIRRKIAAAFVRRKFEGLPLPAAQTIPEIFPEFAKVDLSAIPDDAAFQGMKIVCTPMPPKRANGRTQRLANCAWCPNERQADTL